MSAARWRLLQGKRTIHLVSSGRSPAGLFAEFPACGATYGFPFESARYSGKLNPGDYPKCRKCLALQAPGQRGEG